MPRDAETQAILEAIWAQVLHIIQDVTAALQDGTLTWSEGVELGRHGVELVAMIVRLVTRAPADVQTQLRQTTPGLVHLDAQEGGA